MRCQHRARLTLALLVCTAACGNSERSANGVASKSAAHVRAERRAYDGAPPVIPHDVFSANCTACHNEKGLLVPGVGFAPNMPHAKTVGVGKQARCTQCHVYRKTEETFRDSLFAGLHQDLRKGRRHHVFAPPVMPHATLMRENCQACHTGPAAREEIRCRHPERTRCTQCHMERTTTTEFPPAVRRTD